MICRDARALILRALYTASAHGTSPSRVRILARLLDQLPAHSPGRRLDDAWMSRAAPACARLGITLGIALGSRYRPRPMLKGGGSRRARAERAITRVVALLAVLLAAPVLASADPTP